MFEHLYSKLVACCEPEGRRVYWEVLHRLFEEQLAEDLIAVLGHLVLLRFTERQIHRVRDWKRIIQKEKMTVGNTMHTQQSGTHQQWFSKDRMMG